MITFITGGAVALAMSSISLPAAPVLSQGGVAGPALSGYERIWLVQGKAKGGGKQKVIKKGGGNGKDKGNSGGGNGKTEGKTNAGNDNGSGARTVGNGKGNDGNGVVSNGRGNGNAKGARKLTGQERQDAVRRVVSTDAPEGRDMARILGASGLALATTGLAIADTSDEELIEYANCPPGLAKKDPPCVPPGLARKGVTYEEWLAYDRDGYDALWRERRTDWLDRDRDGDLDSELLLLGSDHIADLFGLDAAPDGQRYALIDGLPVLLDDEDYDSLLLVNGMAQLPDALSDVRVAPTAALTQDEMIRLYRLPQLDDGQNYSVVNGRLLQLNDESYEILQLIRVARAIL